MNAACENGMVKTENMTRAWGLHDRTIRFESHAPSRALYVLFLKNHVCTVKFMIKGCAIPLRA